MARAAGASDGPWRPTSAFSCAGAANDGVMKELARARVVRETKRMLMDMREIWEIG